MNIRNKIDNLKKPFNKGEKWEKFAPAFNALDTFLFVPKSHTITNRYLSLGWRRFRKIHADG